MSPLTGMLIGLGLLIANAFFVAAEFALIASRQSRLEQLAVDGSKRARTALDGKRQLSLMLAGAQLGITMTSLGLGAVAEPAIASSIESLIHGIVDIPAGVLHTVSFLLALTIVVLLHMIIGEMAPKSAALADPERAILRLSLPFMAFARIFRPVIWLLNAMANGVTRLLGVEPQNESATVHSPADLLLLMEESRDHGSFDRADQQLFTRSLELSGKDATDAMTPRREIVAVDSESNAADVAEQSRTSGRSRVVVYEGDLDHVVGIVHIKDVLVLEPETRPSVPTTDLMNDVFAVYAEAPLEDVLVEMRTRRQHLAVVADEHGIVIGLVSLEDVLEELIDDFEDESDRRSARCRRVPDGSWSVAGDLRPDELEHRTGLHLPDGEWDTVAGYVIDALGHLPSVGDQHETGRYSFRVTEVDGFAVTRLSLAIRRMPDPADDQPAGDTDTTESR